MISEATRRAQKKYRAKVHRAKYEAHTDAIVALGGDRNKILDYISKNLCEKGGKKWEWD